jgi:hypothetical protein
VQPAQPSSGVTWSLTTGAGLCRLPGETTLAATRAACLAGRARERQISGRMAPLPHSAGTVRPAQNPPAVSRLRISVS